MYTKTNTIKTTNTTPKSILKLNRKPPAKKLSIVESIIDEIIVHGINEIAKFCIFLITLASNGVADASLAEAPQPEATAETTDAAATEPASLLVLIAVAMSPPGAARAAA